MKNVFEPVKRDYSMNTYSWISTVLGGSGRSEWASPWMDWASEQSERIEAERCRVSEQSERCKQTNIVSDQVARSKRDCLWLETHPHCFHSNQPWMEIKNLFKSLFKLKKLCLDKRKSEWYIVKRMKNASNDCLLRIAYNFPLLLTKKNAHLKKN